MAEKFVQEKEAMSWGCVRWGHGKRWVIRGSERDSLTSNGIFSSAGAYEVIAVLELDV